MKKIVFILLIFQLGWAIPAYAGRVPSVKTAVSLSKSYFKHYGKKYKESFLGQNAVQQIEIHQIFEQSRHYATIEAVLTLHTGQKAHVLLTSRKNPPFGWSIVSWELIEKF